MQRRKTPLPTSKTSDPHGEPLIRGIAFVDFVRIGLDFL